MLEPKQVTVKAADDASFDRLFLKAGDDAIFDRIFLKDGDDAIFDRLFLKDVDDAIFDRLYTYIYNFLTGHLRPGLVIFALVLFCNWSCFRQFSDDVKSSRFNEIHPTKVSY